MWVGPWSLLLRDPRQLRGNTRGPDPLVPLLPISAEPAAAAPGTRAAKVAHSAPSTPQKKIPGDPSGSQLE